MSRVTFAIVASSLLLVVNGQVELKSFLGTCVNTGSSLDSCLLQLADKLKPYMKTGIPSLNIPKTDPMDIDKIAFQLKNPLGVVTVKFTENTVEGLSTHTINSIRANKAAKTLSMDIFVPKATAKGLYHMQGVLGPLELDESLAPAPYTTSFTGTTVSGVAKMDVVGGKLQIVQQPDVTINVEGLNVQMENLFGGEADGLAKVVLRFVNKESDKFIKDFQPEIAKQVSELIKTFFNSALDNIPVSTFSSLNSLNLRSCDNISDIGVGYLAEGCVSLHTLDVSFCERISDRALAHIASGLFNLRTLSMAACRVTDEGLTKVAKTLLELQTLNIGQCFQVSDVALQQLGVSLLNLRRIDLYGCPRVTRHGLQCLGERVLINTQLWH